MRVQTMFGRISAGTNERLFGPALVLLRIAFGGLVAGFAISLGRDDGQAVEAIIPLDVLKAFAVHESLVGWILLPLLVIGVLFIFGLLTRPASIALIAVLAVIDLTILPFATIKMHIFLELFMVSVALMGLSGGLGNAFGLNGLILRNISSPGALLKFLFS